MITFISTIIALGAIIFVHELGHFLFAKSRGVLIEKFSIGFPPTLLKKKIGETVYAIGAIPFGGYVKMSGENPLDDDEPISDRDFKAKSIGARASILSAGSIMNLIFGIALFWIVLAFHGTGEITKEPKVGSVVINSPADSAGMMKGDEILFIDTLRISSWEEMAKVIHSLPGKSTQITIKRNDSTFVVTITPVSTEVETDSGKREIGLIGIQPEVFFTPQGIFRALPGSFVLFFDILQAMAIFIGKIFSGDVHRGDIGGPVMIAKMAGTSAQAGWAAFLFFMAALSINLGVLNLFPFPVLDGGQIVYLIIEAFRKKPIPKKMKLVIQQIGFLLILLLMIYVTISDFLFVFGR